MKPKQPTLPGVDTSARAQGRAERGATARKRWREFRWLTSTIVDGEPRAPSEWHAWHVLCDLGRRRGWWTKTDVLNLLRPYRLRGRLVPTPRAMRPAPIVPGPGDREPCCNGRAQGREHDRDCHAGT